MRNKTIFLSVLLALVAGAYVFSNNAQSRSSDSSTGIRVRLKPEKRVYTLGEVVSFNVELRNQSLTDVMVSGVNAQSGYLKIWIAGSSGEFKEYVNSTWGNKKNPPKKLSAGKAVISQATVFANSKPETSHLSEFWAKQTSEGRTNTGYAFPDAGVYRVKAVLVIPGETMAKVESDSVEITIEAPTDEELEVWNKIKNRGDIAYFIQEGEFVGSNDQATIKFLREVEGIVESYPNSFVAGQLRQSLDKYNVDEAKRIEAKAKVKRQQKPSN